MTEDSSGGSEGPEGSDPELEAYLQELEDLVGGEEGKLFAKQMRLGLALGGELQSMPARDREHLQSVVGIEMPNDVQQFVNENLIAPDSPMRRRLLEGLSPELRFKRFVKLLQEMEDLVKTE